MGFMKQFAFISDIHIKSTTDKYNAKLLQLLDYLTHNVSTLYILGDFFDYWIGDDDSNDFISLVKDALLKACNKNLSIYFMHGNRDFLLGDKFVHDTKIKLIKHEIERFTYSSNRFINLNIDQADDIIDNIISDIKIKENIDNVMSEANTISHTQDIQNTINGYLCHGDILCTLDHKYQRMKKIFRSKLLQYIFLKLPIGIRSAIKNYTQWQSNRQTGRHLLDHATLYTRSVSKVYSVVNETVMQHTEPNHAKFVIHGHTHQPGFYLLKNINNNSKNNNTDSSNYASCPNCNTNAKYLFDCAMKKSMNGVISTKIDAKAYDLRSISSDCVLRVELPNWTSDNYGGYLTLHDHVLKYEQL